MLNKLYCKEISVTAQSTNYDQGKEVSSNKLTAIARLTMKTIMTWVQTKRFPKHINDQSYVMRFYLKTTTVQKQTLNIQLKSMWSVTRNISYLLYRRYITEKYIGNEMLHFSSHGLMLGFNLLLRIPVPAHHHSLEHVRSSPYKWQTWPLILLRIQTCIPIRNQLSVVNSFLSKGEEKNYSQFVVLCDQCTILVLSTVLGSTTSCSNSQRGGLAGQLWRLWEFGMGGLHYCTGIMWVQVHQTIMLAIMAVEHTVPPLISRNGAHVYVPQIDQTRRACRVGFFFFLIQHC